VSDFPKTSQSLLIEVPHDKDDSPSDSKNNPENESRRNPSPHNSSLIRKEYHPYEWYSKSLASAGTNSTAGGRLATPTGTVLAGAARLVAAAIAPRTLLAAVTGSKSTSARLLLLLLVPLVSVGLYRLAVATANSLTTLGANTAAKLRGLNAVTVNLVALVVNVDSALLGRLDFTRPFGVELSGVNCVKLSA
jgi:hypothetical protein